MVFHQIDDYLKGFAYFNLYTSSSISVQLISYTHYKIHIHERGAFSGECIHIYIYVTHSMYSQVIV